ncbi:Ti-type conjugative transfer relaxase TraA [Sphingomonas cavernae]|uniref:Ti-type conjugative transfer relaxase TraA n=1 Tax=Sphingomonas cavernae TaxID=2320861 RepID=A0A418WSE0_9SPHN|nr:Ti-type conjugative transfer relaxase TraA [Sphingomonas cavernae]RJF94180.1 Ti-type conjugative transfer relaxase TraA [Sphingomonas cavernae]
MAIYHFSAKVISRATGRSAVACAAYRSASRIHDQRLERTHDFSNKAGVVHSEILLPGGAPDAFADRDTLWNAVEAAEKRIDAQLAREIEFAIPREMTEEQGIVLARDFVAAEFVDRGMIADLNVHWDVGADGLAKPHAHVMLTMRSVDENGFGAKVRDWNRAELLQHWREAWASHVNRRLAELDIDAAVDHRSLEAQGIDLEPQHKIGPAALRMVAQGRTSERLEEHCAIARRNGMRIIADPGIALDAITHTQATFTKRDLAVFIHRHSDGKDQFDQCMHAVRGAPDLVALGKDGRGEDRFTSRAMIATEHSLEQAAQTLAARMRHRVPASDVERGEASAGTRGVSLGAEQRRALIHITEGADLSLVIGYAGTGKSTMLGVAREAWEFAGYRVRGAALSGIAAENLESGSAIPARTIASLEHQWRQDRDLLTPRDVLVIDEAGMIGARQMERVISEVEKRGAKLVLVGDPQQLQAIEAGAAFRAIHSAQGGVEITEIRRQHQGWQRDATRALATGRVGEALDAYREHGAVHAAATRETARARLIECWDRERSARPQASRIILTHTNDEVRLLNEAARARLRAARQLRDEVEIETARGERSFARGDRIMFLRNERSLGVKNGSLGRIARVDALRMSVLLDDGRSVAFDIKDYADLDHGYAATIHKAQGLTVDRVHVLATPGLDRHASYVALSRHRDGVELHYGRDDFTDERALLRTLSRERSKDMAGDYDRTDPVRAFAERRGIAARIAELVRTAPHRARQMVDNLRARQRAPAPQPKRGALAPGPDPHRTVARHGRIVSAILFAQSVGDPASPEQRAELQASRAEIDRLAPHGAHDLEAAFAADRGLIRDAAGGQTQRAIRAMQLEAELRTDPRLRADMFINRWQVLDQKRQRLLGRYEERAASRVTQTMAEMAKSLERDPQLESLLRGRRHQLGLSNIPERSLGQSLADMIGWGRSRGPGIGM